jgi:5-(carboxyamino)imidazole ribonucleotide mutase
MSEETPLVVLLMGSANDAPVLEPCAEVLRQFGLPFEQRVLSAHRTPEDTAAFVRGAEERGVEVVIAAAGMAAHLAGACAAQTTLPVIGVPVASGPLNGQDALLSTVMMPPGMPVATVAINGAANAGHLAAQILSLARPELRTKLKAARARMREKILEQDAALRR